MAQQFFFIHLMKTAGTSFRVHAAQNFRPDQVFPLQEGVGDFEKIIQYVGVHQFVDLPPEERANVRFFSAHVPAIVAWSAAPGAVTITIVRHPVDRTLSYLRHSRRDHAELRGTSLQQIYDDPWHFTRFIENHQTKMLSMSIDEALQGSSDSMVRRLNPSGKSTVELRQDPEFLDAVRTELASGSGRAFMSFADRAPAEIVQVDERRLAIALDTLDRIDALGTTDHLDDLMTVMTERYGWAVGPRVALNQSGGDDRVPASFLRRISAENGADLTLYERALQLRSRPTG